MWNFNLRAWRIRHISALSWSNVVFNEEDEQIAGVF
jgi:hypothetical protein